MILLDLSQVMWRDVHVTFDKNNILRDDKDSQDNFRLMLLTTILMFKRKFASYGNMVICCDSDEGYWRKKIYPNYKESRKAAREASIVDSNIVRKFVKSFIQELKDNFKFHVIGAPLAEADDVIAVLAKWSYTNDLEESMFDTSPKPVVIVSEDMDFGQLLKYKHVKLFGPRKNAFLKLDVSHHQFLTEHIVRGDPTDTIGNILSPDNCLIDHIKQKSVTKEILERFYSLGIDACSNEDEKRKWLLNKTLVDFDYIPPDISDKIIQAYIEYKPSGSKSKILNYLSKNRCGKLLNSLGEF